MFSVTAAFPSDIDRPCLLCGTAHAWRDGLCRACDQAERNAIQVELADHAAMDDADVDAFAAEHETPEPTSFGRPSIVPLWIGPCCLCGFTGRSCVTRSCPRCGERAVA